jgi:hypothetical protein
MQKRTLKRAPRRNKRKEAGNLNRDCQCPFVNETASLLSARNSLTCCRLSWAGSRAVAHSGLAAVITATSEESFQIVVVTGCFRGELPNLLLEPGSPALQIVVRDLWAYQLAIHRLPISSDTPSSPIRPVSPVEVLARPTDKTENDYDSDAESSKSGSSGRSKGEAGYSGSDKEDKSEGVDEELLAQLSDVSSDSEMMRMRTSTKRRPSKKEGKKKARLKIVDTVVTLVVALWVLRVPVMNVEIER